MTDAAKAMQSLAKMLDAVLNAKPGRKDYGFVLLVFNEEGQSGSRTNYVSNCDRKDIIAALKEVTGRFEGQPEQSGRA
jgi:hypothetical protein